MSQPIPKKLITLKDYLIKGMVKFMKFGAGEDENDPLYDPDFNAGYAQEDVDACEKVLDQYLSSLFNASLAGKNKEILLIVKTAILALNDLNAACDGTIIETDQREQIAELINLAARQAGLKIDIDDITEEWRMW